MEVIFMAYSERLIKPVLLDLSSDRPVTLTEVAEYIDMPYRTVYYSVQRMLKAQIITRKGKGKKGGYQYYEAGNAISA